MGCSSSVRVLAFRSVASFGMVLPRAPAIFWSSVHAGSARYFGPYREPWRPFLAPPTASPRVGALRHLDMRYLFALRPPNSPTAGLIAFND